MIVLQGFNGKVLQWGPRPKNVGEIWRELGPQLLSIETVFGCVQFLAARSAESVTLVPTTEVWAIVLGVSTSSIVLPTHLLRSLMSLLLLILLFKFHLTVWVDTVWVNIISAAATTSKSLVGGRRSIAFLIIRWSTRV